MVSLTPNLALPYQTGAEFPCDAPGVWCDLAELAAASMAATDLILGRLSPAIPVAKIRRTATTPIVVANNTSEQVTFWDSALIDTDDMVDLSQQAAIRPNRVGTYCLVLQVLAAGATALRDFDMYVTKGPGTSAGGFSGTGERTMNLSTTPLWSRYVTFMDWESTDQVGFGARFSNLYSMAGALTITGVDLAAYWINDRTS